MDTLPDFSISKIEIRNRIEGALRVKRKKPSINQYSLFICFFLFTSICTALYLKSFLQVRNPLLVGDIDYHSLEKLMLSEQLDSESVIILPENLSLRTTVGIDFKKGEL